MSESPVPTPLQGLAEQLRALSEEQRRKGMPSIGARYDRWADAVDALALPAAPDEPFERVSDADLEKMAQWLASGRALRPVPVDTYNLANMTLHMIREVRAARALGRVSAPPVPPGDTETLTAVYDAFGIGSAARTPSVLLTCVGNALRRFHCLAAIERKFFTVETPPDPDEDGDEPGEECLLNWGSEPAAYVEQFRTALAIVKAHAAASPHPAPQQPPADTIKADGLVFMVAYGDKRDVRGMFDTAAQAHAFVARFDLFTRRGEVATLGGGRPGDPNGTAAPPVKESLSTAPEQVGVASPVRNVETINVMDTVGRTFNALISGAAPSTGDAEMLDWIQSFIRKHDRMPEFHPDNPDLRAAIRSAMAGGAK